MEKKELDRDRRDFSRKVVLVLGSVGAVNVMYPEPFFLSEKHHSREGRSKSLCNSVTDMVGKGCVIPSGYAYGVGTTRQTFGGDYGPETYNVGDIWGGRQE
eukprot:757894-Hanusia_phi.AAC.3